jgi:predicted DNA-binding transcriptional regulator AlpA
MTATINDTARLIAIKQVSQRYGVSYRTIDRWLDSGALPPPAMVQKTRRYWRLSDLEAFERSRVGKPDTAA